MLAKKISQEFYHLDSSDSEGIILARDIFQKHQCPYLLAFRPIPFMKHPLHGDGQDSDILKV